MSEQTLRQALGFIAFIIVEIVCMHARAIDAKPPERRYVLGWTYALALAHLPFFAGLLLLPERRHWVLWIVYVVVAGPGAVWATRGLQRHREPTGGGG